MYTVRGLLLISLLPERQVDNYIVSLYHRSNDTAM
jgi:hypothetical protein